MERTLVDNRYRIVGPLGRGGMAKVCLAHDDVLDRDVALKVMDGSCADEEFVERFKREARSAAGLSHPNIVPVYDQGRTTAGEYYISMEYLPGGTLKEKIAEQGRIESGRAVEVALEVAEALGEAHEHGIVHRDIKPHNVLITARGGVKVADFGIARAASSETLSQTGSVFGTAVYMSPEQALGEQTTPKSDLYSLGVVLYEMLTGEAPFTAENPVCICLKHVGESPRSPKETTPDVPESVSAVVMRLLSKSPEDRHATAAELVEDLEAVRKGLSSVRPGRPKLRREDREAPGPERARTSHKPEVEEVQSEELQDQEPQGRSLEIAPEHSPGLAAVMSFVISGLGQIYNGQIFKGVIIIVVQLVNFALTAVLIGWIPLALVWVWAIWDAHRVARRIAAEGYGARRRLWPWVVAVGALALATYYTGGWHWLLSLPPGP